MGRHLLAAAVVVTDTALMVFGHRPLGVAVAYAVAVALVVVVRYRSPLAAFVAALVLASLSGGAYVVLLWAAYQAGYEIVSRRDTVMMIGAALGGLAVRLVPMAPRSMPSLVAAYVVFVALPVLAGRYLAQHRRLVSTLDERNRQLRWKRELLAEQERLRERLRIARDMHDSLGHRLSLVSVQAAALEVAVLPPEQRQAVRRLAQAARGATDELYELVGALRGADDTPGRSPGVEAIGAVVAEFRAADVPVALRQRGEPRPLSAAAGQAAYRLVEEGLTNATKHAPGQPVTVTVNWEPDALLLTVTNPVSTRLDAGPVPPRLGAGPEAVAERAPAAGLGVDVGHGLAGLRERIRPVGGFVDHRLSDEGFRLVAMLPVAEVAAGADDGLAGVGRIRTVALGFATAALMFVVLPAGMLLGVR